MTLRNKTNEELIVLYEPELALHCRDPRNRDYTRHMLDLFLEFLGGRKPTAALAKEFLAHYADHAPRTLYRYTSMIRPFMKWYGDPIDDVKIKVPKSLPPYTEDAELELLLEAMRHKKTHKRTIARDVLLVELDTRTGMRRAELANLSAGEIHGDFLIVRHGKGEKDRAIPLTPKIAAELRDFTRGMAPTQKVFGLTAASIGNKIRIFAKKAGVNIHTHSLRHKFATDLVDRNANLRAVKELMGHESLATTEGYIGLRNSALREAVDRLDAPPPTAEPGPRAERPVFETSLEVAAGPNPESLDLLGIAVFSLDLPAPAVAIEHLQVRTSDTSLPFRLTVFERRPKTGEHVPKEDIVQMELVRQRTITWPAGAPMPYQNADGRNQLHGAIVIGHRDRWFVVRETKKGKDITPDVSPANFSISLRCRPSSAPKNPPG